MFAGWVRLNSASVVVNFRKYEEEEEFGIVARLF